jgi:hypothetical protein
MIETMLRAYPRLHVDVSWECFDEEMVADGVVRGQWIDLVERFADRFMIGSDMTGRFEKLEPTMRRYDALLNRLSATACQQVAAGNAERVFFGGRRLDTHGP